MSNTRIINGMMTAEEFNELQAEGADQRHKPVVDAWLAGKSQNEIAREYGVTRARIQRILRRARQRGLLDVSKRQ